MNKVRIRQNRKYGTMKLTGKMTIQLSKDVREYIKAEAKKHRLSYGAAIELIIRAFAQD